MIYFLWIIIFIGKKYYEKRAKTHELNNNIFQLIFLCYRLLDLSEVMKLVFQLQFRFVVSFIPTRLGTNTQQVCYYSEKLPASQTIFLLVEGVNMLHVGNN